MLKFFALIFFFTPHLFSFSQKKKKPEPVLYLDSIRLTTNKIFDLTKLASVNETNDGDTSAPGGKIFLTSKEPKGYNFLTAKDLADKYHITVDSPAIFMFDGRTITDTSKFEIDASYIAKVDITSAVNYLMPSGQKALDLRFLKIYSWDYIKSLDTKKKRKKR
jgi:hypothetical protein